MKITHLELRTVALPQRQVFRWRGGTSSNQKVIVEVHTDEGLIGIGEADPVPSDWGHDADTFHIAIHRFIEPALVGANPFDIEEIWGRLAGTLSFWHLSQSLLLERAGVDSALYDLMGKAAGLPVHRLLGGSFLQNIPVAAVLALDEPEKMATEAIVAHNHGYFEFKIKVGIDADIDLQRVRAVREAVGSQARIRVDANGGWSANVAVKVIRAMERYNLELVEQPLARWDLKGHAFLRQKVDTPLMADESLDSIQDALSLIQEEAFDLFNIKYQRVGGLTYARKILAMAEANGIRCMVGGELESGVGTAIGAHLMASSALFTIPADLVGPAHYLDDVLIKPFEIKNGYLEVPTGLGYGVELDEEKMRRFTVQSS